ncbi:MAG: hypothetical protein AAFR62_11325 [Cyanobacteria bacterium J06629_2]
MDKIVRAGTQSYCLDNGVWLIDCVPPKYIKPIANSLNAQN